MDGYRTVLGRGPDGEVEDGSPADRTAGRTVGTEGSGGDRSHLLRRRRRLFSVVGVLVALLLVWILLCVRYVAHPVTDQFKRVDALYVLGPSWERMPQALELAESGATDTIISTITINWDGDVVEEDYCDTEGEVEVICVLPDPYTTHGEALVLDRMAREEGWDHVAVMTMRPHVSRARLWMDRCVDIPVDVWEHEQPLTAGEWLYQFVYQTGAWVKAQVFRGC